ncbi:hypothetical protein KJ866_04060 [Patescibacteria group bacterium]|nr:hypothetical protein [Patescibacteria group bacterium]MBU2219703.1 hypothetical protein [Patescibacteria group bacterium]
MKKQRKKITMDVLAGMVQRGFAETARRVDLVAIKKDVGVLRSDVMVLKADVYTLKEDVASIKTDMNSLKEDFSKLLNSLDKVAKQYADYLEERKVRDAEINRLKRWVEQIAQKVGVELVD